MRRTAVWFGILFVFVILLSTVLWTMKNAEQGQDEAYAGDRIVLRLAETYPKGHPSAMAAQKFADLVYKRTNGRIQIKVYYGGELGNEAEVLEQMQFGGIALARANLLEVSDTVPAMKAYVQPFAYSSPEKVLEALQKNSDNISLKMQFEKLVPLVWYYPDKRCFYNNKEEIKTAENFKNLKLKTSLSGKMQSIMQTLGADPVDILTGDTFKSLNAGFMDGGESSLCTFMLSDVYSVTPYVTVSDYLYCPDVIVGSSITLSKITPEDQKLLADCAQNTFAYQKEQLLQMQKKSLVDLQKKKTSAQNGASLDSSLKNLFAEKNRGADANG